MFVFKLLLYFFYSVLKLKKIKKKIKNYNLINIQNRKDFNPFFHSNDK